MASPASIRSHPIHPILVPLPIGLWIFSLVSDVVYAFVSPEVFWDRMAQCESGGNWAMNSGNGYYGGLQFSLATWRNVGGTGYPHQASRAEQIKRGQILQARAGWGQWPHCARQLGYL